MPSSAFSLERLKEIVVMSILEYLLEPPDLEPEDARTRGKLLQEERAIERERRHINREDDPHFDPTDKISGNKIPGADQTPNHEVRRTTRPGN